MYVTAIIAAFFAYLTLDFHRLFPRLFRATKISHLSDDRLEEEDSQKGRGKPICYDDDHD
jgi:putative Mg2+ transporter-C (MgtC) family protein